MPSVSRRLHGRRSRPNRRGGGGELDEGFDLGAKQCRRSSRRWATCCARLTELPRGLEELERALALDPNMAGAHGHAGLAKVFIGRAEETEAHVLRSLAPEPPRRVELLLGSITSAGRKLYPRRSTKKPLPWLRKSLDANRNAPWPFSISPPASRSLGRLEEARREVKAGLAVDPKFTLRRFRAGVQSDNAVFLAHRRAGRIITAHVSQRRPASRTADESGHRLAAKWALAL